MANLTKDARTTAQLRMREDAWVLGALTFLIGIVASIVATELPWWARLGAFLGGMVLFLTAIYCTAAPPRDDE